MSKTLNLSFSLMAVIASSMTMMACSKNSGSSAAPETATTAPVATQEQLKPVADAAGCPAIEDGAYEQKSEAGHTDAMNRLYVSTTTDGVKAFTMMNASFITDGKLHEEKNQPRYVAFCEAGRASIGLSPDLDISDEKVGVKFEHSYFVELKNGAVMAGIVEVGDGKGAEFVKMNTQATDAPSKSDALVEPEQTENK